MVKENDVKNFTAENSLNKGGLILRMEPQWLSSKESICNAMQEMQETQGWCLGWEDPLQKEMSTHSSLLAWEIPWTKGPGGLQSLVSQSQIQLTTHTLY